MLYGKNKMSCKCQNCKKQYRVDLLIPNELWERVKPKGKTMASGLLCGSCIMKRIEQLNNYRALKVIDI
jgi:glycyl-tRNA synthetase (class II)